MSQAQKESEKDVKTIKSTSVSLITPPKPEPLSEFHEAVLKGQVETVSKLISQNKQLVNEKDSKGNTPLLVAAGVGHLNICKMLVEAGADPLAANVYGSNALHLAASYGKNKVVQWLAINKTLINSKGQFGRTALAWAAARGFRKRCAILLKAGADPLELDQDGVNAMHIAASFKCIKVIRLLASNKTLINLKCKDGKTPLIYALGGKGSAEACEVLLKAGADPLATYADGFNAMHLAVGEGKTEIVRMLSVYQQLLDSKGKSDLTPLMIAAEKGFQDCCELLLKVGANPLVTDKQGWSAMHRAAQQGKTEIVRMLSANKQLLNSKTKVGATPLILAARNGHTELCELLLREGADPLAQQLGLNAMHWAISWHKIEVVRMFAANRQLINSKDKDGCTPLMKASWFACLEEFKILLKAGADPLATDITGRNAMHCAAYCGEPEVVKMLLAHNQLINSKDKDGCTPLMKAATFCPMAKGSSKVEVCEILLKAGADPFVTDKYGATALGRANLQAYEFSSSIPEDNEFGPNSKAHSEVRRLLKAYMKEVIDSENKEGELHSSAQQNKKNERCSRLGCTIS